MSNNENPQEFISKLPPVSLVKPDITEGVIPLPATALLSESERKRLDELAASGTAPVEPDKDDQITTFEDGSVFKWMPRPLPPGVISNTTQCLLIDATGQQIAIVKNENLADFLANACNLFVRAQLKHQLENTPMTMVQKPIIIPGK